MSDLSSPSDTSLRVKQKQLRFDAVVESARKLFREHEFDKVSIEMIAEDALVSPATVYNYFGTKPAILLEIIERIDEGLIENLKAINRRKDFGPAADEITDYLALMVQVSLEGLSRNTWQHAFVSKQLNHKSRLGEGYKLINNRLYGYLQEFLTALIAQGRLAPNTDAGLMRQLLEKINHALFSEMLAEEQYSFEHYKSNLHDYVVIVISGCEHSTDR